jgi:hypothetical protein
MVDAAATLGSNRRRSGGAWISRERNRRRNPSRYLHRRIARFIVVPAAYSAKALTSPTAVGSAPPRDLMSFDSDLWL